MKKDFKGSTPKKTMSIYDTNGDVVDPSADVDKILVHVYNISSGEKIGNWTTETTAISAIAEAEATEEGNTKITSTSHGLSAGDQITIRETSNYNGSATVQEVVDADNFTIDTVYTSDESPASAYFIDGDYDYELIVGTESVSFIFSENMTRNAPNGANRVDIFSYYSDTDYPGGYNIVVHTGKLNEFIETKDV